MSLTHLRAGVIGTGFIGPVHIEALKRLGIQVVAVCDTDANAAAASERFGIPNAIGGLQYQRLVGHPEVDVVHVASPNRLHAEHSLAALAAGKHVVCEKPLAMSSEETAKIVAAAKKSRRVFAVNYNLRFYAALQTLRAMVADGQFGRIVHVNGSYFQDWLFHDTDYNWRLLPKEGGKLRALADIGTHWMDAASFILGDHVGEVFADLGIHHKKRQRPLGEVKTFSGKAEGGRWQSYKVETEDYASVLLHYAGGAHGTLSVSQVAAGRKNQLRLEIYGRTQSAWWDSESPEQLTFGHRDHANQVAIRGAAGFSLDEVRPYMDYPAGHVEGFADSFKMQMRAIYSRIAARQGHGRCLRRSKTATRKCACAKRFSPATRSGSGRRWRDRRRDDVVQAAIDHAVSRFASARRVTVLTGAGVSAASGVPTFRGAAGLWRQFRPEDLATAAAFARDPALVWEWYDWRRTLIAACAPNRAHDVLAAWSTRRPGVTLITQNVDGLHERAGTARLTRLHGSIWTLRCWRACGAPDWTNLDVPLSPCPPRCPSCGGLARPGVVWFGETLDPADLTLATEACRLRRVHGRGDLGGRSPGRRPRRHRPRTRRLPHRDQPRDHTRQ